jgi:hypothetical protein
MCRIVSWNGSRECTYSFSNLHSFMPLNDSGFCSLRIYLIESHFGMDDSKDGSLASARERKNVKGRPMSQQGKQERVKDDNLLFDTASKQGSGLVIAYDHHHSMFSTLPQHLHPPRSNHLQPPRNLAPERPNPHEPQRIHLLPYPHQRTSEQRHAWST